MPWYLPQVEVEVVHDKDQAWLSCEERVRDGWDGLDSPGSLLLIRALRSAKARAVNGGTGGRKQKG